MNIETIPLYSDDLIKQLEDAFPPKCIGVHERPEDAHRYAGKCELVELLIRRNAAMKDTTLIRR